MAEIMCATCGATDGHYPWCAVGQLNADVAELGEAVAAKDRRIAELEAQIAGHPSGIAQAKREALRDAASAIYEFMDERPTIDYDFVAERLCRMAREVKP